MSVPLLSLVSFPLPGWSGRSGDVCIVKFDEIRFGSFFSHSDSDNLTRLVDKITTLFTRFCPKNMFSLLSCAQNHNQ